jgi:hypothetical protein
VSALAAAMSSFSPGDTLSLAPDCVYHLSQALPVVSQDLTVAGNGAMLERSYESGTPAFTILTISGGAVTISNLEIRNGDNGITVSGPNTAITVNDSVFVNNHGTDGGRSPAPTSSMRRRSATRSSSTTRPRTPVARSTTTAEATD